MSEKERVVRAESGDPVKKLVVVRSSAVGKWTSQNMLANRTYSLGTAANQLPLPSRSLGVTVRRTATCAPGL